jgi:hypothetical protein
VLVHVAVALTGLLAFSALTIDLGALWVSRAQTQNAADAAALAGAVSLAYVNPADTDTAAAAAVTVAQQHRVWGQTVEPASIQATAGACPPGAPSVPGTCLEVRVSRDNASGTPLPVFFSRLFGVNAAEVHSTASAKVMAGNTAPCVRPLAILDRWTDRYDRTAPIDGTWTDDDFYDGFDAAGQPNLPAGVGDTYTAPTLGGPGTGVTTADMVGMSIRRVEFDPDGGLPFSADSLFSLDLPRPGLEGEGEEDRVTRYTENVGTCSGVPLSIGATPGVFHVHRPRYTIDPLLDVIGQDPGATWDPGTRTVVNSAYGVSPRIIVIAVLDPDALSRQGRGGAFNLTGQIRNLVGFFLQGVRERGPSADVTGVIVPPGGRYDTAAPLVADAASFLRTVALVR